MISVCSCCCSLDNLWVRLSASLSVSRLSYVTNAHYLYALSDIDQIIRHDTEEEAEPRTGLMDKRYLVACRSVQAEIVA